jgi:hypothetical protein
MAAFFFNHIYYARGTIPKLHIKAKGGSRARQPELSTNQATTTTRGVKVPSPNHSMVAAQWARLSQPVVDTLPNNALKIFGKV